MTIEEVIQRVQSLYSKGVGSWSSRLRSRHIYSKLKSASAYVIRRENLRRRFDISEWSFIPLPCVEMIEAPIHQCPCLPPNGCYIYRSLHKLPKPMEIGDRIFFKSVMSLDGNIVFTRTEFHKVKYLFSNSVLAYSNHYYIHNGYLYITGRDKLKVLTASMLPEDAFEAYAFPSFCSKKEDPSEECENILENEFPVLSSFIDEVIERSVLELINEFVKNKEDKVPDLKDE